MSQRARFAAAGVHESKDSGRLRPHITVTVSTRPGNDRMMASTVLVAAPLSTSPPTAGCRSYIAAAPCCALRCSRRCAALPAIEPPQRDGTELHSRLYQPEPAQSGPGQFWLTTAAPVFGRKMFFLVLRGATKNV